MTDPVELREYQSAEAQLSTDVARALALAAGSALTVSPGAQPGSWTLTATSQVGNVVLGDLRVVIRPKVSLQNLFLLLDAGMPPSGWRSEVFGFGTNQEVLPAFAAFYPRTVDQVTARGLVRSYRPQAERLPGLRGRIDFPEQLRQPALPSPIVCRFDELTADVDLNRYLLWGLDRLLRTIGVDPRTRSLLKHTRARFEGVLATVPSLAEIDWIELTRLTDHYLAAVRLLRVLVQGRSLTDLHGETAASSFLIDMNQVFEDFVTRRLRTAPAGRLVVLDQFRSHLGDNRTVPIRPDLVFQRADRTVFVADVKYKLAPTGTARTADYFQLLAYCTALGLAEGVLIYAQTDDANPDHAVVVRHAGTRLVTYRLDLSGGAGEIEASVEKLAAFVVERAEQAGLAATS